MSFITRRRWLGGASAAAIGAVLAGLTIMPTMAQTSIEALEAAAKAEGSLLIYSSAGDAENDFVSKQFQEKYGIATEYIRLVANPLFQRFSAENDAGRNAADIFNTSTPDMFSDHTQYFAELKADEIPNVATAPEGALTDYYFTFANNPMVITYNKNLVAEADVPRTWADVIDPKWKGRVMMNDLRAGDIYVGWAKLVKERYGEEYLKAVTDLQPSLIASGASGAQQIAAGAFAFNFPTLESFSVGLLASGAPIGVAYIGDPLVLSERDYGIAKTAPHPNAARLFMHWLMSEEATALGCRELPRGSPIDPDGKLGCVPTAGGVSATIDIAPEERAALLTSVGLGE